MSVPIGTLTTEFRTTILDFYGELFGWREMDGVSNDERLTIWTGGGSYINVRERETPAAMEYEHFGVAVESLDVLIAIAEQARALGAEVAPLPEDLSGVVTLKLRHLLPMAIEVQNLPQ
jgi:hypothetical protein